MNGQILIWFEILDFFFFFRKRNANLFLPIKLAPLNHFDILISHSKSLSITGLIEEQRFMRRQKKREFEINPITCPAWRMRRKTRTRFCKISLFQVWCTFLNGVFLAERTEGWIKTCTRIFAWREKIIIYAPTNPSYCKAEWGGFFYFNSLTKYTKVHLKFRANIRERNELESVYVFIQEAHKLEISFHLVFACYISWFRLA